MSFFSRFVSLTSLLYLTCIAVFVKQYRTTYEQLFVKNNLDQLLLGTDINGASSQQQQQQQQQQPSSSWLQQPPSNGNIIDIQIALVTSPAHGTYWERFFVNSNGWQTFFSSDHNNNKYNIQIFTFDKINPGNPLLNHHHDGNGNEKNNYIHSLSLLDGEESTKNSNLLLAALGTSYELNSNASWYFLVEDDTVVVPHNLHRYIETLNEETDPMKEDLMCGKQVLLSSKSSELGKHSIHFVVGGAGILLSHSLMTKLSSVVNYCREKYQYVYYGDARIGACIQYTLNVMPTTCYDLPKPLSSVSSNKERYAFSNDELFRNGNTFHMSDHDRIITLHEKNTTRLQQLNDFITKYETDYLSSSRREEESKNKKLRRSSNRVSNSSNKLTLSLPSLTWNILKSVLYQEKENND